MRETNFSLLGMIFLYVPSVNSEERPLRGLVQSFDSPSRGPSFSSLSTGGAEREIRLPSLKLAFVIVLLSTQWCQAFKFTVSSLILNLTESFQLC